jgi:hypothetical protein
MRTLRDAVLFVVAIATVHIAIREVVVLLSIGQLLLELTPAEIARREAYEVIIAFCIVALVLAVATGVLVYRQVKRRSSVTFASVVSAFALLVYGVHLVFAYAFQISNSVLDDFVEGFAWLSEIGLATVVVLLALSTWSALRPA